MWSRWSPTRLLNIRSTSSGRFLATTRDSSGTSHEKSPSDHPSAGHRRLPGQRAVSAEGTTHTFWQSIRAGAERAGKEAGVTIIWRGPLREDDRDAQVSEVEGFVSRGVSGIVLAPLDDTALMQPVKEAAQKKIPVLIFDSGLKGSDFISFVATDNTKGGRLGGERLAQSI